MDYSKYQKDLFKFITDDIGNAVVEAVAGSGKTTTIVKSLDLLFPSDKVLFVAFNKHIAEELAKRVPKNVQASTLNSVGWSICRGNVNKVKLDAQKDENILRTLDIEKSILYRIKGTICRLVSLGKALLMPRDTFCDQYKNIASKYGIEIPEIADFDFEYYLISVWTTSISELNWMNFDDQIYMPVAQNWMLPAYDWVFGDEAQDWSPVQIEFVSRLGRCGRTIAVGDRHQGIYSFRGADPDAIPNIIKALDAKVLPLSICYRCPDKVISTAREIVPHIESPVDNPKGDGIVEWKSTPEFLAGAADGDFVLCRTTAPLVKRCLSIITQGRKAVVKGRDIGKGLIDLLESLTKSDSTPVSQFLEKLADYRATKTNNLMKSGREAEALAVEDRCDTLDALATDCKITLCIKNRINTIFSDTDSTGITFCTGHRSKGLEANRIWILRPDLCPHPKAKGNMQQVQEQNLRYVMITRSMSELYFVTKEVDEK